MKFLIYFIALISTELFLRHYYFLAASGSPFKKDCVQKESALIFTGSFIIRMAIILVGFYFIGQNSWQKLLICLAGFLIARVVVTRIAKNKEASVKIIKHTP